MAFSTRSTSNLGSTEDRSEVRGIVFIAGFRDDSVEGLVSRGSFDVDFSKIDDFLAKDELPLESPGWLYNAADLLVNLGSRGCSYTSLEEKPARMGASFDNLGSCRFAFATSRGGV